MRAEAAVRAIRGIISATDPKLPLVEFRRDTMFSQLAIVVLGIFLIAMGLREGDYLNVGIGILVGAFAVVTLYKLKTGS